MAREDRMLYLSRKKIEEYQLEQLKETVKRAKKAPYFGERLAEAKVKSLDDLAELPPTTKEDLRAASPFGSVAVPHRKLFQYHESFGTTGAVVSSWLTKNDFEEYARQINQCALDFNADDMLVNKFPYSISVPAHIVKLAAQNRGACVVSASSLTQVCPYTRTLDLMAKLRATVLTCLPTEATLMSAAAVAMGMNPAKDFSLRAIGTAGELLTSARRRRIEQLWGCRVYNYYGTTETGNLASDCTEGKMHLAWDHFLVEVLDEETMKPLPPGEIGVPTITTLTREAMPLIRYVVTDRIKLEYDHDCPCGRKAPIVHHYGRDAGRFPFQGRFISMADLEEKLFRLPIEAVGNIWMIVVTPERVHFRVEATQPDAALYRQAEEEVSRQDNIPLQIDAVSPGDLFPIWWLLEPARVGKPAYYCVAESLDKAPKSLPELWMGPGMGPPPGMEEGGPPSNGQSQAAQV
jgi:phenylacetate-CoA ligase